MIRRFEDRIAELTKQVEELAGQVNELKRRLSRHENSNTPPSRSLIFWQMREQKQRGRDARSGPARDEPKPAGRKVGHEGVTQVFTPAGRPVVHRMDRCPKCDSARLVVKAKERRTVVDIPDPLPTQ